MRVLTRIALLFFATIIISVGFIFLTFLAGFLKLDDLVELLYQVYFDSYNRLIAGLITAIIILKTLAFWHALCGRQEKDRSISFANPSGDVSISLNALEDVIRRVSYDIPEVKEIRPTIEANKGLDITIRLVLNSDVNIPQLTARLQDIIRDKVEDAIGSEEKITIAMHVVKITGEHGKVKAKQDQSAKPESDPNIPFHGYRA